MLRNRWVILSLTVIVLLGVGGGWLYYKDKHGGINGPLAKPQALQQVKSSEQIKDHYDVIVVGTDPEGVVAAVSAARNGLMTLLVDGKDRQVLGGLMTLGWLNTVDNNFDPAHKPLIPGVKQPVLNKGIFSEWYGMVEGDSFDVNTAANAFYTLVRNEKNIDLLMQMKSIEPILAAGTGTNGDKLLTGLTIVKADGTKQTVLANAVIDATQDADIAAVAGVPFTKGREDMGDTKTRMAVTLVFRLKNVDAGVWSEIRKRLSEDNDAGTDSTDRSANGYKDMKNYPPIQKDVKMRGLNIGRQNDGTVLINALQIFGIDGLDPNDRARAFQLGNQEVPHVVEYMKQKYPEFAKVELDGTAPELYVRETRHMVGEYRLNIVDLLENKDQWDRIAFGSYASDIQATSPTDGGDVALEPTKYAIPFRSIVPLQVDGLLVVGRSASYDSRSFGSARVIPNGMAEAEAAGAAAKLAIQNRISFRQLSASKEQITQLQSLLNKQGMELQPFTYPAPFEDHKDFAGLKAAVYLGITSGGYGNTHFDLDKPSNSQRVVNSLLAVKRKYPALFPGDPSTAIKGMADASKQPVSLQQASLTLALAIGSNTTLEQAQVELEARGLLTKKTIDSIDNKQILTNGDFFLVLHDVLQGLKIDIPS